MVGAYAQMTPVGSVDWLPIAFLAVSAVFTVVCWVALWRGPDRLISKVVWTLVSAVPVLGPLLFAGVHDPPSVQPEVDQAQGRDWDTPPPDHH